MADKDLTIKVTTSADTAGADAATEAVKQATEATKELTAAEADRAKRKEEYEARLAAKRADGSNTSAGSGEGANPMTDGSQLAAGPEPEAVKESTAAIVEQAEALEELTDAEAGVIDATKRLDQTADDAKGIKSLFDQQRLKEIGREIEKLGATVGGLAQEFMKTQAGQDLMAGLSEETKTFGSIALQTGTAVAQGWAQGGPIGAALAGLNVLVKEVGESFIAVAKAEEEATADLAAEQDRLAKQSRERAEVAADRRVADAYRRESEWLEDQNERLEEGNTLLRSRAELAAAQFGLKQEQDRAQGKPEAEIAVDKIQFDRQEELKRIRKREFDARQGALDQERKVDTQYKETMGIAENKGTDSPEYRASREKWEKERNDLEEARRKAAVAAQEMRDQMEILEARTAQRLQEEARRQAQAATRDTTTRAGAAARDRETRAGLGREAGGIADRAGDLASPEQKAVLDRIGGKIEANPDAAAFEALGAALERMLTGADDAKARALRGLLERVERIEAKMKKGGDAG